MQHLKNACYLNVSSGRYAPYAKNPTVSTCPAGKYKEQHKVYYGQTSSCGICAVGTYSELGAENCVACPTGYTTATTGSTAVNSCFITIPAGKYLHTVNTNDIRKCASGHYNQATKINYGSANVCKKCPAGQIPNANQSSCYNPTPPPPPCQRKRECGCAVWQCCRKKYSDCVPENGNGCKSPRPHYVCDLYNCC